MNESAQDAWFYTRDGERLGPVAFSELQLKARESVLNPRLDMVWTQGMAEWKPAGEIDGLFEKRAALEPQESLAPTVDAQAPKPSGEELAEMMSSESGWPGARRRSFFLMTLLFPVVWQLGFAFGSVFLAAQLGPEIMQFVTLGAMLVPFVLAIHFGLMRLVNVGMSRWWYLANFVPLLNVWVGYRMFACPAGYAYHKKLDGVGIALAIFYWLMVVIGVLMVLAVIALLVGIVDDPNLQKLVQEAIREAREGVGRR